ncbi:MAG: hypothetical protein AB7O59_04850 [Pirellulales bacterium]
MRWQDARIGQALKGTADVLMFLGLIVGALVSLALVGQTWGAPIATMAGAGIGWLGGFAAKSAILRAVSRACPICEGQGKVLATLAATAGATSSCARCGGSGRIL